MRLAVRAYILAVLLTIISALALASFAGAHIPQATDVSAVVISDTAPEATSVVKAIKSAPCKELQAVPPHRQECNRSLSTPPANGRTRLRDDSLETPPSVLASTLSKFGIAQGQPPGVISAVGPGPIPSGRRAAFWAVFARAPRLRN